jgi:hypothetical protein
MMLCCYDFLSGPAVVTFCYPDARDGLLQDLERELRGRNWEEYLKEAHRTLQPFGYVFVEEPAKRRAEDRLDHAARDHGFNTMFSYERDGFRYVGAVSRRA